MTTISEFLSSDHQLCDSLFATAEASAAKDDWDNATTEFSLFRDKLKHHFSMEENVMFPAFEACTGMTQGPTMIMRSEHDQMTDLLDQMEDAVASNDRSAYLGDADTLLVLMQQHNMKEEQMLYQMADQVLANDREVVVGRMRAMT